jgi:hypothetical protein
MLQAERSRIRFPMRSFSFFFNLPNPSGRTRPWGILGLLTGLSTRNRGKIFLGSRALPALKANNLTVICESIAILSILQPHESPQPVSGDRFYFNWRDMLKCYELG